jgi:predicted flap endonuclease-1-like 5' DNA nuclease
MQTAQERLYLTADKSRLVRDGDKAAAFLYAAPGDEIPDSAVQRFGLVGGRLPDGKGKPATEDKERKPGSTKGDDLTQIKGVGKATAAALAAAGITSFAALAAVDPEHPPVAISGAGEADWAAWVAAAQEQVEAAGGGA